MAMESSETGPESGAASESGPEKLTGPFRKGHDPRRGRGPKPRAERDKAVEGVPLTERMARVLTEELSDAELKKLLKESPADYRRLMELAQKASSVPVGVGDGPRDGDEAHVRKVIEELLDWMRERAVSPPPS